ncbi:MAG: ABC transporter permease [Chloroflexota bacterium]|nr:ABC transporter permease [Chloroflexota bacterium]
MTSSPRLTEHVSTAGERAARPRRSPLARLDVVPAGLLLFVILVPLAAMVWRAAASGTFWSSLAKPIVREALQLSAITTGITLVIAFIVGTPLALLLARHRFPGKHLVETVIDLPLVLPPVVAGIALLLAFGRRGLLGEQLTWLGVSLPFTTAAVVIAQVFVSVPFYVRSAKVGILAVPQDIEEAAAVDGAAAWAIFRDVTFPLALPGLAAGTVLCWARALSEFGATLLFAGSFQGRTQTMPLAIMAAYSSDLDAALAVAVLLLVLSAGVLLIARYGLRASVA